MFAATGTGRAGVSGWRPVGRQPRAWSEARAPLLGGARGAGARHGFLHGEPTARPKAVHEEEARGFVHTRGGRWQRELLRPRRPPRPRGGHGRLRSP